MSLEAPRAGRVIAVVNPKGGVGKTTTAVGLASAAAEQGLAALVVDLDPRGDASEALGVPPAGGETTRFLIDDAASPPPPRATALEGLEVLRLGRALAEVEPVLWRREDRGLRLRRGIRALKERFDLVWIDCPPGLSLLMTNALSAADAALVPVDCAPFALGGLAAALDAVRQAKKRFHPALTVDGIVITRFQHGVALQHAVERELRDRFGPQVLRTVIPEDPALPEAASHGRPIVIHRPSAPSAWAYTELAKEMELYERSRETGDGARDAS